MSIGIWTPTVDSTEVIVFSDLPKPDNVTTTVKPIASKVGAHLLFINQTCEVMFWSASAPGSAAKGVQGVPIPAGSKYVIPNPAAISYLYSPYAFGTVFVSSGTMT